MILASNDLGEMDWNSAKTVCATLVLNGYSDWRLPTKEELNQIYLNKEKIGGYKKESYWSSTEYNDYESWVQNFDYGIQYSGRYNFRAVRAF